MNRWKQQTEPPLGASLHASKLINGFEGGYVTTDDDQLADTLLYMRGFGFSGHDNVTRLGTNAKLNEVHASMALASLDDLEDQVQRNIVRYRAYQSELDDVHGIDLLQFDESQKCSFKNIVVKLSDEWPLDQDSTVKLLNAQGILACAYYSPPLHRKPYSYEVRFDELPVTDELGSSYLLLPCGARVTPADIATIVSFLREIGRDHASAGAGAGGVR